MRFSFWSGISLLSLSMGALAAPTAGPADISMEANLLAKRAPVDEAMAITSDLLSEIKLHTAQINATSATLTKQSSAADKKAARASVGKQLQAITLAVKGATRQARAIDTSSSDSKMLAVRQAAGAGLAQIVANIILELSGALNGIIADLGLTALLSFLNPLLGSLSLLLLSLIPVVNNLLDLVRNLLDGLLVGLAAGLAGLLL